MSVIITVVLSQDMGAVATEPLPFSYERGTPVIMNVVVSQDMGGMWRHHFHVAPISYEPYIRALLGTASHFCEVVVLTLRTFARRIWALWKHHFHEMCSRPTARITCTVRAADM